MEGNGVTPGKALRNVNHWLRAGLYPGLVAVKVDNEERPNDRHAVFAGLCLRCGGTSLSLNKSMPAYDPRWPWYFLTQSRSGAGEETEGYVMMHYGCLPADGEVPDEEPVWAHRALRDV